ncbi:MAG: response regulator [Anaerolineae bacterium]|nr:response regulator [Anaerolineae bacterium]
MGLSRERFAEQVKDALQHIYDPAYLPQLELTRLLAGDGDLTWQERSQRLRRILIGAIERLDPGPQLPLRARERRTYAILSACYVRSMTAQAVMEELAISERQYWRERRKAIEALVQQLWEDYGQRLQAGPVEAAAITERETVAREEADLLISHSAPEEVSVREVVDQASSALHRLAQSRRIRLRVEATEPGPLVVADRTILRQIFLNLLSHAFGMPANDEIVLQIEERGESVEIVILASRPPTELAQPEQPDVGLQIVRRLVEAQGGYMAVAAGEEGLWRVVVGLPRAHSLAVLVVDDNAAIIKLFQRYLAGTRYRVIGAESGARALELVEQIKPAAITVDVMMPAQDGWDTLQALRARPELQDVPLIVCSILDEPQLALSLGADDFMRKPVQQATLLQTLNRWVTQPAAAARRPPAQPEGT